MARTENWNYSGKADITIGEFNSNKAFKIFLLIFSVVILVAGILTFIYKDVVMDLITKPEIWLKENEITLQVNKDEFIPSDYVYKVPEEDRYLLIYPTSTAVDTKKVGDYEVQYILQSAFHSSVSTLKVHVKDSTGPIIELTQDSVTLTRDVDNFDPKAYIKSISDNYDGVENITTVYPESIDWSQSEVKVDYVATDSSGNKSVKTLTVFIQSKPEVQIQEVPVPSNTGNSGGGGGGGSSYNPQPYNPPSSSPYISGAHNVTARVGTSPGSILQQLMSGVSGSGTVSITASSVNTTVPGTYPATLSSSDGVTKTVYVTITN